MFLAKIVIGGGLVDAETAEYLANNDCRVSVIEMMDKIAKEENITVSQADFGAKLSELSRMYQIDTATMVKQLSQTPGVFNALSQQALNEKVTQYLSENNTVKLK